MTSGRSQPLQLAVDPVAHAAEIARFEAAVVRGPAATDCWLFVKAIGGDGYGRWWIRRDGRRVMVRANRYALAVSLNGVVLPPWERALHGCDVPLCVRVSEPGELGQGLGPGMPLSATGLPANDPLNQLSLLGPASAETPGSHGPLPGPASMLPGQANCEVICLGSQAPLQVPAEQPAPGLPFWMTPSQDSMPPGVMAPPVMPPADPFLPAPPPAPFLPAPPPAPFLPAPPPPAAAEAPMPGLPPTFGALPGPA